MKDENVPLEDACYILRRKLFPFSHDPYPWVKGREETTTEVLKSVLASYVFRKEVNRLKEIPNDPANFSFNLYQPELNENGQNMSIIARIIITCSTELLDAFEKALFQELT